MWKYVNPGYGELLDENKVGTVQDKAKNPVNGVSINNSSGICVLIPNLQEVFLKFNLYAIGSTRSSYWHVLLGDGENYCGLLDNTYADSSCGVKINNEDDSKYNYFDARKVVTFLIHVKNGQNGVFEAYINKSLIKAYSGNIKCSSFKHLKIYTKKDYEYISNIIIADYDIRDESVLVVPLGDPTGTWSGISDGEAKATEVDQVLTQSLKIDDIKNIVGTDTVTSVSVAAFDIRYDSDKVNAMEASITKDGSNLTSATKSITNNAITPVTFMKNMTIDNLANTSVSFKAKKV